MAASAFAFSFTSCSNDEQLVETESSAKGHLVHLVATTNIGDDAPESRTTRPETENGLDFRWVEGDKLLVTSDAGLSLGVLTLATGASESQGTFTGDVYIQNDGQQLNFSYLGSATDAENANIANAKFVDDLSTQAGTFASLPEKDFMFGQSTVSLEDGQASVNFTINSQLSFAHFTLNGGEGVSFDGEDVTITGTNLYNKATFSLASGDLSLENGNGSIKTTAHDNDIYVVLCPAADVELTFTAAVDGKEYTGTMPLRTYNSNRYFAGAGLNEGKKVTMTEAKEPIDHSKNPLKKWAETNLQRSGTGASVTATFVSSYTSTGSYYQFGRNYGYNSVSEAAQNYGVERSDMSAGKDVYPGTGSTSTVPTYYANTVNFSQYTNYFFIDNNHNGDYTTPDHQDNWTERANKMGYTNASPCPEGWRLPSIAEYKEILPVINEKSGSTGTSAWNTLIQFKTLDDGTKCAFRWSKETASGYSYLKIECLVVDNNMTETSEINWDDENVETRFFKGSGYIQAHRNLWSFNGSTQYTARPLEWGYYNGQLQSNRTVKIIQEKSLMTCGGFYWTSDAPQGVFSMVFDNSTGYTLGYYLSTYDSAIGANIRCVRDTNNNQ